MTNFVTYHNELSQINTAASNAPKDFVLGTEEAYLNNIRNIVKDIAGQQSKCRLVMLFGPSSSGKTTTAYLLQSAFQKIGIGSTIISLDDFYRGESQAPLLPNGQHDYECVEALNVPEIHSCLISLIESSCCDMPLFNFEVHQPFSYKKHVELKENEVAIVEGIHALNPVITDKLPAQGVQKIYISVKQGILDGNCELFDANDMRLVRRIVRDFNFRGTNAERTLTMWPSVMDGERKYIKPYRGEVDYTINSLHLYETCVLKEKAIKILEAVPSSSEQYTAAQNMVNVLSQFASIDDALVPHNSILREFIGDGIY